MNQHFNLEMCFAPQRVHLSSRPQPPHPHYGEVTFRPSTVLTFAIACREDVISCFYLLLTVGI